MDWLKKIRNQQVYIYGAGHYANVIYKILVKENVHVVAAITSDGSGALADLEVCEYNKIAPILNSDTYVIMAVSEKIQREVLEKNVFKSPILQFTDLELLKIESVLYRDFFEANIDNEIQSKRILVLQIDAAFGDLLWGTAFLRELRHNFPEHEIGYVINRKYETLYENFPYVDRYYMYDEDNIYISCLCEERVNKIKNFCEEHFKEDNFEYIFVLRMLPDSWGGNWENVVMAMQCRAKYKVAHAWYFTEQQKYYADFLQEYFTRIALHTECKHEVEADLSMLREFNLKVKSERMEINVSQREIEFAERTLEKAGTKKFVAIGVVGSRGEKSWDPEMYAALFKRLNSRNSELCFVLCGGSDAISAAEKIKKSAEMNVLDMTGKTTLLQAAALISRCQLYIGSDTGIMHMASIFEIPIIEIAPVMSDAPDYWDGAPKRMGPWKTKGIVLQPKQGLGECKFRCQKEEAHCIKQITVEEVEAACATFIWK